MPRLARIVDHSVESHQVPKPGVRVVGRGCRSGSVVTVGKNTLQIRGDGAVRFVPLAASLKVSGLVGGSDLPY